MQTLRWETCKAGWFVGNFSPSIYPTDAAEVCIKRYKAGDCDASHFHRIADEITMIIEGEVEMNGLSYWKNDIILIKKNEVTDFRAITDTITCVVKIPCVIGDKYLV